MNNFKMIIKYILIIPQLILLSCCINFRPEWFKQAEAEFKRDFANENVEYYLLGETLVDTRINQNVANFIINRLQTIEEGNFSAFRSTFERYDFQDGAGMNQYLWFVIEWFGDILEVEHDPQVNYENEVYCKIEYGEFIPKKRYMWKTIERLGIAVRGKMMEDPFVISIDILNYEGEYMNYIMERMLLPYSSGDDRGGFHLIREINSFSFFEDK